MGCPGAGQFREGDSGLRVKEGSRAGRRSPYLETPSFAYAIVLAGSKTKPKILNN